MSSSGTLQTTVVEQIQDPIKLSKMFMSEMVQNKNIDGRGILFCTQFKILTSTN